ncbi:MAG TPA: calcium-binding protein, partial [Ramlibacter sp.]|nr:calcium-binding protein [Ramlibacter sp.]
SGIIQTVLSTTADIGGADVITGDDGNDTIVGGAFGDVINGNAGADVILGDSGQLDYTGGDLRTISSTATGIGGADVIDGDDGSDIIVGGAGLAGATTQVGDAITGDLGDDLILGDEGRIALETGILRTVLSTNTGTGDQDAVTGDDGNDSILGGAKDDTIHGNAGNDLVLGESGSLTYDAANVLDGILDTVVSITEDIGGVDAIDGDQGNDILVGGAMGDVINGNDGADVILGDSGRLEFSDGDLRTITSTATNVGGADVIDGDAGNDIIVGGAGLAGATTQTGDVITGDLGDDLVFGDEARITLQAGVLRMALSINTGTGDNDRIAGNDGNDSIVGGAARDDIQGNAGQDLVLGDNGSLDYALVAGGALDIATTIDPTIGAADTISGGSGNDTLLGGTAGDTIHADDGADLVFGDHARIDFNLAAHLNFRSIDTLLTHGGGADTVHGGSGDDTVVGGQDNDLVFGGADDDDIIGGHNVADGSDTGDRIDAGTGNDFVTGDNAWVIRNFSTSSPRLRALSGTTMYDLSANATLAGPEGRLTGLADQRSVVLYNHSATEAPGTWGSDVVAGGAQDDLVFGQLGDDLLLGDGALALSDGQWVASSFEAASDGDDYIEGNGGADVIYGGLGQDDLVGGSSSLFSLSTAERRPDGSDVIHGGAGTDEARNDAGDATWTGHARDADVIAGDNANIHRIVGLNGIAGTAYLTFAYDNYTASQSQQLKLIPRTVSFLDYTPGGLDFSDAAGADIGAADLIRGESGDDVVYGMTGNDVLYGDGQDDDLVGGRGHDWISGGTGNDGVLGDDGRILTSRNGTAEALYGIAATTQGYISTPGRIQEADLNVTGELKKTVNLTPFNVDRNDDPLFDATESDDIIYGGLGNDSLHGGAGDDAISGAEALTTFWQQHVNPGDVLAYNPVTGEFAAYDEYSPRKRIAGFLLDFDAAEGITVPNATYGTVASDGNDKIFGDLGNDWLVGGTGRDNLYGGWGDDLLNADDDPRTSGGLNDQPDTHPLYEDRAFGGAGRDRLIGNTGGDRLIDWSGEFNSYIVPFSPNGAATISRTLQPQLAEFLYALSASDGADHTRALDTGASALRNGEPEGELGLVRQQDAAWHDQTGSPDDPQPGNIPGGKRDILRSATFNNGGAEGFAPDSGVWNVVNGTLQVAAESIGRDAVSVYHIEDPLPGYFEVQASITVLKPGSGWKANSYIIFDYQHARDFKFAGIDVALNKLVMGHRDANGWQVDEQASVRGGLKTNAMYNMLVAVNGLNATLLVDNALVFSHTYAPRVDNGYLHGLNWGLVGVGSDNSRGTFDNIAVQVLPPKLTFEHTEDFADGVANLFTGPTSGTWSTDAGRYTATVSAGTGASLMHLGVDHLNVGALLDISAMVSTNGRAGVIFDRYADNHFKFAAIDAVTDQVLIGHHTAKHGWVTDAAFARAIDAGVAYKLGVTLKGTTVSVTLNDQAMVGHVFNASVLDGSFGLLARNGASSFDNVTVKTNDPAFIALQGETMEAAAAPTHAAPAGTAMTISDLDAMASATILRWTEALGNGDPRLAALAGVRISVEDLPQGVLGYTIGNSVIVDVDGAGHGWFVDATPGDDREFSRGGGGVLRAGEGSEAAGRMDLLTVLTHEFGHLLGFEDGRSGIPVMDAELAAGTRLQMEQGARQAAAKQAVEAAPEESATSAPAPVIDWGGWSFGAPESPQAELPARPASQPSLTDTAAAGWKTDFVSHLGKTSSERDPNAKISIVLPRTSPDAAKKVGKL